MVGSMGILGVKYEEIGRGLDAKVLMEEVIGIEEVAGCGIKKCEDIGSIWGSNDIEGIGEVEGEMIIGMFCDAEGVPLVAEMICDKLISEKDYLGNLS